MNQPLVELASFSDYDGLRRALNAVRDTKRDMSFELLDEITGAPRGYFSKALGPRPAKRIGLQSLGWALGGLGIKCVLVEDPEALARIQARLQGRDKPHLASVRGGVLHVQIKRNFLRKIGAKGGIARWCGVKPKKRSRQAKAAAKARHSRLNEEQRKLATAAATRARWKNHKQKQACSANGSGSSQGHAFQQSMAASSAGVREPLLNLPISGEGREGSHRPGLSGGKRFDRKSATALSKVQFIEGAVVDRSPSGELEGANGKDRAPGNPGFVDGKEEAMKSKRKTKEHKRRARQRRASHKARRQA